MPAKSDYQSNKGYDTSAISSVSAIASENKTIKSAPENKTIKSASETK